MSSHGPCFLSAISVILRLKNILLVFFTVLWKDLQFSSLFKDLYLSRSLLQLSSHKLLECLVMLVSFIFLLHTLSTFLAKLLTAFSSEGISNRFKTSKFLIALIMFLTNSSSTLFFWIVLLRILIILFNIMIITVKRAWLEERHHSE